MVATKNSTVVESNRPSKKPSFASKSPRASSKKVALSTLLISKFGVSFDVNFPPVSNLVANS